MIHIAEIFGPTIQGEGPNVGIKTLFVRVMGCDFNCEWCDSKFAWKKDENTKTYNEDELIQELYNKCVDTSTKNIVLTGGNPCLYDFTKVIKKLADFGIDFDVETQGSKFPSWLKLCNNVVISPKAPSSKQPDVMAGIMKWMKDLDQEEGRKPHIAIKIPVFDDIDFEFAQKYYAMVLDRIWDTSLDIKMYLSVGNTDVKESGDISKRVLLDYEKLIDKTMNSGMQKVYVLPQVHTLVWGNKQGV